MKMIKKIAIGILACVFIFLVVAVSFFFTRFQTISSIKKLTNYDDGYNLYSMNIKYDYNTQNIIDSGFTDTQSFVNAVIKEAMPFLPVKVEIPSFGCSAYRAMTDEGDTIMGRNYDFRLDSSCMLLYCAPKHGYKSIAFAALNNIQANNADENLVKKLSCLMAPFSCLDGVNEKGVSIAVLTLDSEPTNQNTGREKIATSLAIRLVLDCAATTQEAVDILKKYDMYAVNGRDYHFFISDASGDSRVIDYDCEDESRTLVDTPMQAITNFYAIYIDKVQPKQINGIYGHGKERYDYMMEIIEPNKGILTKDKAWEALKAASTAPNPESVTSNTQWSVIFNNTRPSAEITIRRKWDDIFTFSID